MSRHVSKRCREIEAMARTVVGDLGFSRPYRKVARVGPPCVWAQPVGFSERDFDCRTRREVAMLVLQRVTEGLKAAWEEIRARHGVPEHGFEVRPVTYVRAVPDFDPAKHPDYLVTLVWEGPQGETPFWPHAVAGDEAPTALGTEKDEAEFCGLEVKDYRKLVSGDPAKMAEVGSAVDGSTEDA